MKNLNKLIDIPDVEKKIQLKKSLSREMRVMKEDLKPRKCLLCDKDTTSFCNSHTIPRLSLKNISETGKLTQAGYLIGSDLSDNDKGVSNSGTIQIICRKCDSFYFQEYENEMNLRSYPSDKMLSQMALKNFLLELVRRREEKYHFEKSMSDNTIKKALYLRIPEISSKTLENTSQKIKDLHNSFDYDIEDFQNEILLHKTAIEDNLKGAYQIIFHEVLPYKSPIAFQGSLTLIRDMYGYPVNDTSNHSKNNRIQKLHLAILPLKEKTMVLAFYHKRDRKYKPIKSQFNSSSRLKKLEFLNYLIFAYTENYYFSPKIKEKIITNEKLVLLSQELFGEPNLGQYVEVDSYKRVEPDEIPNFLLEEWAII